MPGHRLAVAIAVVSLAGLSVLATPALAVQGTAGPATSARYQGGASATVYAGKAFDTCEAPSVSTMSAWRAAPYRTIGIYIGGVNRTCPQLQLNAAWVAAVSKLGWRLLPVYKGLQAPCGGKPTDEKIDPDQAASQGTAAADDAVAAARSLGLTGGSALYNDLEAYTTGNVACRTAVLTYLSGWTAELHRLGYVSGVYAQLASGATDLAKVYTSTGYARPDALWIARYDGKPSLTGWAGVPDAYWAVHQRAKQFSNSHYETFGGVKLSIDSDQADLAVATVGYSYKVTSATPLSARTGPSTSYPAVRSYLPGSSVTATCQAPGQKVGATSVWDKLADGSYVTDYYVSTPSVTGYSAPLPRCAYPFQVTASGGASERSGPGVSYPVKGTLPNGALAWLTCQRAGSKVGTTKVWDYLRDGRWVSDFYVSTFNKTSYSRPVPRC